MRMSVVLILILYCHLSRKRCANEMQQFSSFFSSGSNAVPAKKHSWISGIDRHSWCFRQKHAQCTVSYRSHSPLSATTIEHHQHSCHHFHQCLQSDTHVTLDPVFSKLEMLAPSFQSPQLCCHGHQCRLRPLPFTAVIHHDHPRTLTLTANFEEGLLVLLKLCQGLRIFRAGG